MAISSRPLLTDYFPFQNLNDYDVECLFKNTRREILARLNNPVLLRYLKNHNSNLDSLYNVNCSYYTEDEFNLRCKSFGSNLSTFHLNIRKIGLHGNELLAFLSVLNFEFDVIILTEVGKNCEKIIDSLFHRQGYTPFYDLPSSNNYGGVAVFIKSELNPIEMQNFKMKKTCSCSKCCFENVWVECNKNGMKSIVGGIYRHPGGDITHFNTDLDMSSIKSSKYKIALWGGDVNIDIIQQDSKNIDYVTTLASHKLLPFITRPTRITSHSATLIDHTFIGFDKTDCPI